MITADMARNIANDYYAAISQKQKMKIDICLDQIEKAIKTSAKQGLYSFTIYHKARFFEWQEVEKEVKNALEFMNFEIQNDTGNFIISWVNSKEKEK